jgi:hypothetical protein
MSLINLFPRAADEIALLSPAELAEMDAWFAFLDEANNEAEVDTGAL